MPAASSDAVTYIKNSREPRLAFTLPTFGLRSRIDPTVARQLPPDRPRHSTRDIHSAAAASASRGRRRSGVVLAMVGLAPESRKRASSVPRIPSTMPSVQAEIVQHRPLLDVELDVCRALDPRGTHLRRIQTVCADRVTDAAVERGLIEASHYRAAANERHAEPHAFLFREADHFDGNAVH